MKAYRWTKALKQTMQEPIAAFAIGALCGVAFAMLCLPFSKGIVIGSYNEDSHEERDHITTASHET